RGRGSADGGRRVETGASADLVRRGDNPARRRRAAGTGGHQQCRHTRDVRDGEGRALADLVAAVHGGKDHTVGRVARGTHAVAPRGPDEGGAAAGVRVGGHLVVRTGGPDDQNVAHAEVQRRAGGGPRTGVAGRDH